MMEQLNEPHSYTRKSATTRDDPDDRQCLIESLKQEIIRLKSVDFVNLNQVSI